MEEELLEGFAPEMLEQKAKLSRLQAEWKKKMREIDEQEDAYAQLNVNKNQLIEYLKQKEKAVEQWPMRFPTAKFMRNLGNMVSFTANSNNTRLIMSIEEEISKAKREMIDKLNEIDNIENEIHKTLREIENLKSMNI